MKYIIKDKKYHFVTAFDTQTGMYIRSGVLDDEGKDTGVNPFMASFPHLIDVGIMGHCTHGKTGRCLKAGVECYQDGLNVERPNMTIDDFAWIVKQCRGKCNQFALGGRGDPDQHENIEEILRISRENDIVPNFTTSGFGMTNEIAQICRLYCGAVAVSWYRNDYTYSAIKMLLKAGVRTNIHYVIGKNSIDEVIYRLKNDDFPIGINAVIFLLHKPVGLGREDNVLKIEDNRFGEFFEQIDRAHPYKVGMDSCSVPGALHFCRTIMPESLDTCEGGRFSCYIDSDMNMLPCSFDQSNCYGVSLKKITISKAWNSEKFYLFREHLRRACPQCEKREMCMGGCPLMPQIVCCNQDERNI